MITKNDVLKVSELSKLRFSEKDLDILTNELNNIIKMIDELRDVDCQDVEPLTSVLDNNQKLRDDEVELSDISLQILSNAPGLQADLAKELKCFIVPKVID